MERSPDLDPVLGEQPRLHLPAVDPVRHEHSRQLREPVRLADQYPEAAPPPPQPPEASAVESRLDDHLERVMRELGGSSA